jgi:hypothetical protein
VNNRLTSTVSRVAATCRSPGGSLSRWFAGGLAQPLRIVFLQRVPIRDDGTIKKSTRRGPRPPIDFPAKLFNHPKSMRLPSAILAGVTSLLIVGCTISPPRPRGYADLDVNVEQASVRLLRNGMTVCLVRTQLPNVETWKLINGNMEIVVKSRGSHGPAAIELFDTRTGVLKGKIMASAIQDGRPEWAQGFEE